MIRIRRSQDRGHFDFGWLDTWHSFSFGDYHDPEHMAFRTMRVLNEDWVKPGQGFGTHAHKDMEILSYVLEGAIAHKDSLGHVETLRAGEVQRMSAGTGLTHSEFNPSPEDPLHLLQIWIFPERKGLDPGYEQKAFQVQEMPGRWHLIASKGAREGSLHLHQDAELRAAYLEEGSSLGHELAEGRHAWIQVARGAIHLHGHTLRAGDGAAFSAEPMVHFQAVESAEVLLFDLG